MIPVSLNKIRYLPYFDKLQAFDAKLVLSQNFYYIFTSIKKRVNKEWGTCQSLLKILH